MHQAKNLVEVGQNMVEAGFAAEAYVPQPVSGMTTRRVLFMELLQGPKLKDGLSVYAEILAAEKGLTLEEFEAAETERIELEGTATFRLNFHHFDHFELDLRGHILVRGAAFSCLRLKLADTVLI